MPASPHWIPGLLGIDVWDEEQGRLVPMRNAVAAKALADEPELRRLAAEFVAEHGPGRLKVLDAELAARLRRR